MNELNVIAPYKYEGLWVFDDPRVGLVQEPFVGGADDILDQLTSKIPNADAGFTLVFSANDFAGSQHALTWQRAEKSGNVYYSPDLHMEGWLCPALLRYFDAAPKQIFVQLKPLAKSSQEANVAHA